MVKRISQTILLCLTLALTASAQKLENNGHLQDKWVGTWATAPQKTPTKFTPKTTLSKASLRQIVKVSIGGERLRLRLSNRYANKALHIRSMYIADALDSCLIDQTSACYLTFKGRQSVSIKKGEEVYSDAVDYTLRPLQRLSITIN